MIDSQGPIQGVIEKGGVTDDTTPTLNGTGEPGDTIIILDKGEKIGETVVDGDGNWTFTPETELGDGDHEISVIIKDKDGNESVPSDPWEVTVDTQAPGAPTIGSVYDDAGVKTGELISGDVTDDTTPTLNGQAEAGSTVVIYDNGQKLGETRADANGNWSFTPEAPLAEGEHSFTVSAIDTAGNTSDLSLAWDVVIDTSAPAQPGIDGQGPGISDIIDDQGAIQGPIEKGGVTDDTTPTINGTGEPGDTIIILDKGEKIGETVVDGDGNWTFTPETELGDGEHEISVIIQDPAGNQSEPSDTWEVIVDTQAPGAPTIGSVYDDAGVKTGELVSGDVTDDTTPTLNGQAEAGSTVVIYDNGQKLGETRADANGNWSFTPEAPLAEGEHSFTVSAIDTAGNTSDLSLAWDVVIDTSAPAQPGIDGQGPGISDIIDDQGAIQGPIEKGGVTDDTTPTINGTGEPGDTIIILDKGEKIGETVVDGDGNWTFTPETELGDGEHEISVIIQDPAGNQSEPSDTWEVIVDTQAPGAPTIGSVYDDAGVKTGELVSGDVTDDTTPTLNGQAEAGSTVVIYDNGQKLGETRADANGNWSFTPEAPLAEGEHSFTVSAIDTAGNTSDLSLAWDVVIDTSAPAQPGIDGQGPGISDIIDDQGAIQGPIEKGGVTDDTTPTINGTGEPGDTIIILDKGEKIGETVVDGDGNWTFTPETELGDGEHEISVIIQDPAGNQSEPSDTWEVIVDTQAPGAPTIGSVYDDAGVKTGELVSGDVTDDTTPTLNGQAEAGSTVVIYDNGQKLGETRADANGNWSFTPEAPLAEGEHSFTVSAIDTAGNTSDLSQAWDVVINTAAPDNNNPISDIIDDQGAIQGPIEKGGVTDDTTPTINGTGEPGDTIIILDKGEKIGETVVDGDGNWTFTPETELGDGEHEISVIIQDPAGNQSEPSDTWEVIVDTQAPGAPTIGSVYDDAGVKTGELVSGDVTDDTTPTLNGQAEAGSTVVIYDNGQKLGETRADANGNWSFTPEAPLAEGEHSFTVSAIDTAGNTSDLSLAWDVVIDTSAPAQPGIDGQGPGISDIIDDQGAIQGPIEKGGVTDDTTPTINGTGEPGDTIIILDKGEKIGETVVDGDGNWTFTPETELGDGEHEISVIIQDPAGNQSEPSDTWEVIVDTQAPGAPTIGSVYDDAGVKTGELVSGDVTDDTTPTLNGQAEAGSTVVIYDNGQKLGETRADANGNWSFTPEAPLAEGEHSFTVSAIDTAGNTSDLSLAWDVVIDTSAPAQPGIDGQGPGISDIIDDQGAIQGPIEKGGVTDDTTPTINGTGEPGDTIIILDKGEKIGETVVDGDGNWTFTPETELGDGEHEISVIIQDPAGNQSEPSDTWEVIVDTQAPGAPTIGSVYDDAGVKTGELVSGDVTDDTTPTLNGQAEAGSTVVIYDNGQKLGETRADANGNWSFTPEAPLAEGEHSFTVSAIDTAGNTSDLSLAWDVVIDTSAPAQPGIDGQGPGISDIIDDQGAIQGPIEKGGVTDDTTPTINGTGEPGDTIIILDKGEKIGETVVDGDGNWTFTPETELGDGEHEISVIIQDPAGNQSEPSDTWEVIVDTQAPGAPTIGSVYDDAGVKTGELVSGDVTDDTTPTLNGQAEAGSTVVIYDNGQKLGETRADANGNWSFTPEAPLAEGEHSFTVSAIDTAGNTSDLSLAWDVVIDTSAPAQPGIDGQGPGISDIIDDQGAIQGPIEKGGVTDDTTPTINGTGEPGDTIIILDKGEKIGETVVDGDGNWTFTPETELGDGEHEISVIIQDPAGNQSEPSDTWEVIVDTQAPDAPTISSVYDDVGEKTGELEPGDITDDQQPTLAGQAEAGSTVVIYDNGQKLGETRADAIGNWSFTPEAPLAEGEHSFTVSAIDTAGNTSGLSQPWEVMINDGRIHQPIIETITDDIGELTGALSSGDVTDDTRPEISGSSESSATVVIYDRGVEIGRVQADDQGKWTFTPDTALADGEYSFTAIAVNAAGNSSPTSEPFDLIVYTGNGPTQIARLSYMGKDSGQEAHDYITDNGSFGRLMQGELSAKLSTGQSLQISTDGGQSWFNALVDGTNWAAQDMNAHTANWSIQTRVVDQAGNAGYVMTQDVTLDTIAPRTPSSILLNGNQLQVDFNPADVVAGDRIAIIADGGAQRFEHTLTQDDIATGFVNMDVGSVSSASAALVDQAGNLSGFVNTDTVPGVNSILIGDVSEVYGQARDNIFTINDVSVLDQIKVIEGNAGVDTLKLVGANQVLDLSTWQGRLSSVEVIDLTGSGDNTLKVSLGDVLDIGHLGAFINDDSVQLAVKGNAGDVVQLSDLLPNGMDVGDWENLGEVIAAGVTYDVYHHTGLEAEILVQQGVTVQII
ncbi:Ig-like domain repeat protein [Pseudomonas sp. TH49]|uniref:Ig-like domain-containing protein n=1 Tax=Pseudomonas sp. TH49 TaxID=2796413 RepID=UPI0019123850|nr:Ig-like domain-containing protein [Pseudomonas sp. TH49]MBK5344656.1 Ig-like domain repeat protein [Pseudomonas sp. TH49]